MALDEPTEDDPAPEKAVPHACVVREERRTWRDVEVVLAQNNCLRCSTVPLVSDPQRPPKSALLRRGHVFP